MNIFEEILKWSKGLPNWQSDALRRIWTQDKLSQKDIEDFVDMIKIDNGLPIDKDENPVAIPLTEHNIGQTSTLGKKTILRSLHSLNNINAINSDQRIDFCENGITIIYGDNASGKSGYSRVLKHACRARGFIENIHPNIYEEKADSSLAKASIEVKIEGNGEDTISWIAGQENPDCLVDIAVFDSRVARVYVDEANKVTYIPYGLDAFTKLAQLCRLLKTKFQQELEAIPPADSVIFQFVGEGKIIQNISEETSYDDIDNAINYGKKEQERLDELAKIVADYKTHDPMKKAEILRRQKNRVNRLRRELYFLSKSLSKNAIKEIKRLYDNMKRCAEASRLASERAFSSEPLSGTGNETWKIMFEAARKFSEKSAYPSKKFPVIDEESRCVLCQQFLDNIAKDRLKRFWEFIQHDVTKTEVDNRNAFENYFSSIKNLDLTPEQRDPQLLEEIKELSKSTATGIENLILSFSVRVVAIEDAVKDGNWANMPKLYDFSKSVLSKISKKIELEAKKCEEIAMPEKQSKAEKELDKLNNRKKAHENKAIFKSHIDSLKAKKRIEQCIRVVDTTSITRKQTELMDRALTKELKLALEREFRDFGLDYFSLNLKKIGSIGSTYHQLKLPTQRYEDLNLSEILSEGEQSVVAIASFLAELSTTGHKCGIILDDPVCSLDHHWRDRVARRLIREALQRQVIVFTHDIVFLLALECEAKWQKVPILVQTVRRIAHKTGISIPGLPWLAMSTKKRLKYLKQFLQDLEKIYGTEDEPKYHNKIAPFFGLLRETWERAIEEVLLNDVMQPFRKGVETKRLQSVFVDDEDYLSVDKGMDICSRWIEGHDKAPAAGSSVPSPSEITTCLTELEDFVKRIRKREDSIRQARSL